MTDALGDLDWSGTSDGPAALRARAALTVEQRVAWLDEALDLALASGALATYRARCQAEADCWTVPGPTR
ncbi:MAG: hypothetical protein ABR500_12075 [Dermatophilaceae bacterium]|nr:hypothetical protein [Intrasporangiaceae bacterium]